jgi:hypothetical protein
MNRQIETRILAGIGDLAKCAPNSYEEPKPDKDKRLKEGLSHNQRWHPI